MPAKHLLRVLLLGIAVTSCTREQPPESTQAHAAAPQSAPAKGVVHLPPSAVQAVDIKVEPAQMRECPAVLKAMGKILAPQSRKAIVSYFLPGRI
jgi:hypothetical protein